MGTHTLKSCAQGRGILLKMATDSCHNGDRDLSEGITDDIDE